MNQLFNLINNLDKQRFEPIILTLKKEKENTKIHDFLKIQIPIISMKNRNPLNFIALKKYLKINLNKIKPDIVQTQGIRADLLLFNIHGNTPLIFNIRTNPCIDYRNKYGYFLGVFMSHLHLRAINKNKYNIACSSSLSKNLEKYLNKKIEYIQNAVDDKYFFYGTKNIKSEKRKKIGVFSNKKILIYVGPLNKGKNVKNIISAFIKSKKNHLCELLIVGDGPEKKQLLEMARNNSNIRFVGSVKNVVDFYHSADYYISASSYEGLPNSVLEAMACGTPVILSSISAHKEIFKSNVSNGLFFSDVDELRNIFDNIFALDWEEASRRVRKIIEFEFNARLNSEKFSNLYLTVLNEKYGEK